MKILNSLILLTAFALCVYTQTNQTIELSKTAVIDTERFYNEETGIKRLASAEKQMGMTDCAAMSRYYSLTKEIEKAEKEITNLRCQKAIVEDKLLQLQKLKNESKKVSDEVDACKKIVRARTVDPIIETVREKLREFAKRKGYGIVAEKFSSVVISGKLDDITSDFIQFCNDYFDKEKLQ